VVAMAVIVLEYFFSQYQEEGKTHWIGLKVINELFKKMKKNNKKEPFSLPSKWGINKPVENLVLISS